MKSKTSDMIRVLNELIPSVQKLNSLYRNGFETEVKQGLKILVDAIERGETIGNSPIVQRLDRLEQMISHGAVVNPPNSGNLPAAKNTEPEVLTERELCDRFNISPSWRQFVSHGWTNEFWLAKKCGAEYLGNDRYLLQ